MNVQEVVSDQSFSAAGANAHMGWAGRQFVLRVRDDAYVATDGGARREDMLHFTPGDYYCRVRGADFEGVHIVRVYAVGDGANRALKTAYVDARTIATLARRDLAGIRPYGGAPHAAAGSAPAEREDPPRPWRMLDAAILILALAALFSVAGSLGAGPVSGPEAAARSHPARSGR